ncbi:hypothetical protein JCM3770_006864 [Rhodotorula araucariae]
MAAPAPVKPSLAATLPLELQRRIVSHHMVSVIDPLHFRTLRAICLISKAWLAVGREFLYKKLFFDWIITVNIPKLVEALRLHAHLRIFTRAAKLATDMWGKHKINPILDLFPALPNLREVEVWSQDEHVDRLVAALEQMPHLTVATLHCELSPRLTMVLYDLENLAILEIWNSFTDPGIEPKFRLKGLLLAEPCTRDSFELLTASSRETLMHIGICGDDTEDPMDLSPFHRVQHVYLFPPEPAAFDPDSVAAYVDAVIASARDLPELVTISLADSQRERGRCWDEFQPNDAWLLDEVPPSLKYLDLSAAEASFDPEHIIEYVANAEHSPKLERLRLRNDAIWAEDKGGLEAVAKERGVELLWMRDRGEECLIC